MNPFDGDKKKRRNPFDFMNDDDFERIFDEMQKMFESTNFKEMIEDMFRGGFDPNKRFVHGFSMHVGSDGKPKIQEFGNKPQKAPTGESIISDEREPITDIIESEGEVSVTVEVPGVEKDDINLNVNEDNLEITVNNPKRKYYKKLDLPCGVKPKTTKATYKNGVLDVVIKRLEKKRSNDGFQPNIE